MSAFFLSDSAWKLVASVLISRTPNCSNGPCMAEVMAQRLKPAGAAAYAEALATVTKKYPNYIRETYAALAMLRLFWNANRTACAGRYCTNPHDVADAMVPPAILDVILNFRGMSLRELQPCAGGMKALQCLRYQCSETPAGMDAATHEDIVDAMKHGMDVLAYHYVMESAFYKAAPWG